MVPINGFMWIIFIYAYNHSLVIWETDQNSIKLFIYFKHNIWSKRLIQIIFLYSNEVIVDIFSRNHHPIHCKGNQNRHKNQHENAVLDGKFYTRLTLLNVILISQWKWIGYCTSNLIEEKSWKKQPFLFNIAMFTCRKFTQQYYCN